MPDAKTKIRPQQSCLKCRERKVKCDRSIPCKACIARGIEAECTYLTTAEDRAHINQAEIIDRLRREVAQLRGRLNQPPRDPSKSPSLGSRMSPGSDRDRERDERRQYTPGPGFGSGAGAGPAHGYLNQYQSQSQQGIVGYGAAYGSRDAQGFLTGHGHDPGEGSWRGSSPSSTMTSSATVMSPESTGSENGSGLGSGSVSGSGSGSGFPLATGYVPQVADMDGSGVSGDVVLGRSIEDQMMSGYYAGSLGASFSPGDMSGVPVMGVPPSGLPPKDGIASLHAPIYGADGMEYMMTEAGKALPYYPDQSVNYPIPSAQYGEAIPHWGDGYSQQGQFQQIYPRQTPSHSSINTFAKTSHINIATNPNTYTDAPPFPVPTPTPAVAADPSILANPTSQHITSPAIMDQIPNSWKGQGKQELLETLLETIGSCDEQSVAQVVQVVRTSASPEEAVSGICRVLGIGSGQ
ncbi:hypothetical protein N7508_010362 [Penicillium antarcticum]|uniref:uncharacterized protein n=1 Tax=Penicillium antarcticum TaxID=416450 RepID=UPI0023A66568|nr:uncharacterized protein N7508_010362 [Penicillium antarcticum]KAJ5295541.1 hypothetical protein N7508_010362 [Penicillium antarcticum]